MTTFICSADKKKYACLLLLMLASFALTCSYAQSKKSRELSFKKSTLTNDFISEGVAVADVNKDGKMDVLAGGYWFEAPGWKKHQLSDAGSFKTKEYSNSFLNFTIDINHDGWIDLVRIGMPGELATWFENPRNAAGNWKEHYLFHAVGNESPALHDINMDGTMDLVCADNINKKMVWVSAPVVKTDTGWTPHIFSNDSVRGTHMYTHGLGFGDMNLDGREDVIMFQGWWEAPADRSQTDWTFHEANLGGEAAQMYVMDLDEDGDMDVISSSAHDYGIWWHEQVKTGNTISWKQHEISKAFSQTHAMALADINGDGHPDLITGKRYYAHNGGDPGAEDPSVLFWFEYVPGKSPKWIPHPVDDNSGVGLQAVTIDINNDKRMDIIIGNKKGVFIFEQIKP